MKFQTKWTRRTLLGGIGLLGAYPSANRLFARTAPAAKTVVPPLSEDVYADLGVVPVINGQGTMTMLGGSLIPPEVEAAMAAAAKHFVPIPELQAAAGNRIAKMLNLPENYSALVTSGAAGAITAGTAAVLTGDNEEYIRQLPLLDGMKSEVIIQRRHRYAFDHQIRCCGVKLVEVDTVDDVRKAVNPKTALMFFTNYLNGAGQIKVDEFAKLAKELNLPSFNDAAADTPPVSHLTDYVNMGYDMVAFSGGKAIRGPQCAGLLLARKDLVTHALVNSSPYEDTVGRAMKVGKEEIVGMVKALEVYLNQDHDAVLREWWRRLDYISGRITKVRGVSTAYFVPEIANHVPHMNINWDPRDIELTPGQAFRMLKNSKPSIVLGRSGIGLSMNSFMLQPGEERIIAQRLVDVFREHAKPA